MTAHRHDEEIHELLHRFDEAMRAKDARTIESMFTEDNVMFALAPPLESDAAKPAKDENQLEKWFATWRGGIDLEHRDVRVTSGDDVAFCHGLHRMSGTKVDGEEVDLWFRETFCFCKVDGEWKIAHSHESVPFYMDGTQRAATDLSPE
jgi:uncharacterized protein (TIGR02246 family)